MQRTPFQSWSTFAVAAAAVQCSLSLAVADPITIEFNITQAGFLYQEAGFSFRAANTLGTPVQFNASATSFASTSSSPAIVTMTSGPGDVWDVLEMQVAPFNTSLASQTLKFTGTQLDGTVLTASFNTIPFSNAPETVSFTGFTDLVEFTFRMDFTRFDNLQVDLHATPEPSTGALAACGLVGLAAWGRRRRKRLR